MDSTHKTNRFNLPLLLFSSVDSLWYSYVVACCLLEDETIPSYNTALSSSERLLELRVVVVNGIITDQDNALVSRFLALSIRCVLGTCK